MSRRAVLEHETGLVELAHLPHGAFERTLDDLRVGLVIETGPTTIVGLHIAIRIVPRRVSEYEGTLVALPNRSSVHDPITRAGQNLADERVMIFLRRAPGVVPHAVQTDLDAGLVREQNCIPVALLVVLDPVPPVPHILLRKQHFRYRSTAPETPLNEQLAKSSRRNMNFVVLLELEAETREAELAVAEYMTDDDPPLSWRELLGTTTPRKTMTRIVLLLSIEGIGYSSDAGVEVLRDLATRRAGLELREHATALTGSEFRGLRVALVPGVLGRRPGRIRHRC